ncbi:SPFH domain-containing protein [Bifidobacterium tsurumiense]|uniref:Membrane protease subunit n=1 Tax=Bifidobacterium tsurumiense TaxID=356829 RepID=A0A087EK18_9BIFI|nr:SPFH domain-containing protein [Bifidobacterium tsurumiense]KFJ08119.1 membrane protease subunit [Bifidobacterium tsurumiense]MDY4678682.1 SPFH domain-containing protein [Bifidobacterium tsurumiense]
MMSANTTTPATDTSPTAERQGKAGSGWPVLFWDLLGFVASIALFVASIIMANISEDPLAFALMTISILLFIVMWIVAIGFFTLQPNEAKLLVLFGEYKGTIRGTGFYWANPFFSKTLSTSSAALNDDDEDGKSKTAEKPIKSKISLRARTLTGPKLKVNDKNGNPIQIANVIVWHVSDTARAAFDVDHYEEFVAMQSETALRHVASQYAYDHYEDTDDKAQGQITLRSNITEVSQALKTELSERLAQAGVTVDDARLTHLAYAPEIAQVMLRRQQAEAIIAARTKIVQGAVSMVNEAITELDREGTITLDEERKAAMVSNLMVVLCGDNDAQPVINTGTLYN